ncbi:MAG: AtpZ/AtpI family protein [Gemmatimonadales bacterium]|nr:MAG: AtpZ/AtpI family protein [Gemmatimonadales bacterium]
MTEEESQVQTLARFTGHGLTLALATGLFLAAGWWLDGRLGTAPLFTILGAMTGAGAGFYSMVQHLVLFPRQAEEERKARAAKDDPPDEGAAR